MSRDLYNGTILQQRQEEENAENNDEFLLNLTALKDTQVISTDVYGGVQRETHRQVGFSPTTFELNTKQADMEGFLSKIRIIF